jgi:hypothetical protein
LSESCEEAREKAKQRGFISRKNDDDEWENLCPDCK